MFELAMAALGFYQYPAVFFQQANHFTYLHPNSLADAPTQNTAPRFQFRRTLPLSGAVRCSTLLAARIP